MARVGSPLRLFYNKLWGPLRSSASLTLKAGFNVWEEIEEQPMRRAASPLTCWRPKAGICLFCVSKLGGAPLTSLLCS